MKAWGDALDPANETGVSDDDLMRTVNTSLVLDYPFLSQWLTRCVDSIPCGPHGSVHQSS